MSNELNRRRKQTQSGITVERVKERRKASLEGNESRASRDRRFVGKKGGQDGDEMVDGDGRSGRDVIDRGLPTRANVVDEFIVFDIRCSSRCKSGVKIPLSPIDSTSNHKCYHQRQLTAKLRIVMMRESKNVGEILMRGRRKRWRRIEGEFEEGKEEDVGFEGDDVSETIQRQSLDGHANGGVGFKAVEPTGEQKARGEEASDEVEGRLNIGGGEVFWGREIERERMTFDHVTTCT